CARDNHGFFDLW
nr:immunoglobulin heavy chain junction region [Macaca mulatta]MOW95716.1 immunoglobulin heavy chain junction region [Macaca mulatta]